MMDITLIAALGKNRVIGHADGSLPWKLPDDVAHFKRDTLGKPIVQGRKTFDTVGKPLPKRKNIVLTRHPIVIEGCTIVHDVESAIRAAGDAPELMVIGGGEIYALFLPRATKLTLTLVDAEPKGEAFFPEWDRAQFHETERTHHAADDRHAHAFDIVRYRRI